MKKTFGIGIVGCGYSASRIQYSALEKVQNLFNVKACFDIDKNKADDVAKIYDAKPCTELNQLLEDPEINLIVVCTKPASTHAEIGMVALDAGKHVLLEKPMCGSHEEGVALIQKAADTGKVLSVYQNRRWDPDFLSMQWAIKQGYFGEVKLFETLACGNQLNANWLFDWGVHLLDQALQVCGGKPIEVSCGSAGDAETESGPWFAMIRFDNGKTALVTMRTGIPGDYPRYSVNGDKGAAAWPIWSEKWKIENNELIFEMPPIMRGTENDILNAGEQRVPFIPFYQNLYDVLEGKAELLVKPEQALTVVDVALAVIKSSQEKKSIKL